VKGKDVEDWLAGHDTYALHKPFPRNPYTVINIDDILEMYLADACSLSKYDIRLMLQTFCHDVPVVFLVNVKKAVPFPEF
jgi:hypothetical protein